MFDLQISARIGGPDRPDEVRLVLVDRCLRAIMAYTTAVDEPPSPPFAQFTVHLFTNPLVPTVDTTLADLTEATWPGYAAEGNLPWSPAGRGPDGSIVQVADLPLPFVAGSPIAEGTLLAGVYITDDNDANSLNGVAALPVPIVVRSGLITPLTLILQFGNS